MFRQYCALGCAAEGLAGKTPSSLDTRAILRFSQVSERVRRVVMEPTWFRNAIVDAGAPSLLVLACELFLPDNPSANFMAYLKLLEDSENSAHEREVAVEDLIHAALAEVRGEAERALRVHLAKPLQPRLRRVPRQPFLVWPEEHAPLDRGVPQRDEREQRGVDALVDAAKPDGAELHFAETAIGA